MVRQTIHGVFLGLLLFSINAVAQCDAYPGEQCPSPQFLTEYRELIKLRKELDKLQQSRTGQKLKTKSDQFMGAGQRVGSMIPPGYGFDEGKMKFVSKAQGQQNNLPTRTIDAPPAIKPETVKPEEKK